MACVAEMMRMKNSRKKAMSIREPVVEMMDPMMVEVMRDKTPFERLAISFHMWNSARVMISGSIRQMHPDWSDGEVNHELARRMSHREVDRGRSA